MKWILASIALAMLFFSPTSLQAQCTSGTLFGSAAAPNLSNVPVTLTSCFVWTDYAQLTGVQAGETYVITVTTATFVSIYSGPNAVPANLVTSGVANLTISFTALTSGTYDIVFYANNTCPFMFTAGCETATVTCTTCPGPVSTDTCANAMSLSAGSHAFSTIGSTGNDVSTCGFFDDTDVWATYTAPSTGTATFTTCGSGFNTTLQIYADCPANGGRELACSDNFRGTAAIGGVTCSGASESVIQMLVQSGTTYYIRMAGTPGTGTLNVVDPTVPTGQLCSDALVLLDGIPQTINLGTFSGSYTTNDQQCSSGGSNNGIFFRFNVPQCGDIEIDMSHLSSDFNWFMLSADCSGLAINTSSAAASSGCATGSFTFRDVANWTSNPASGLLPPQASSFSVPGDYILYIEPSGVAGSLTVSYNLLNNGPAPTNDQCVSPFVITNGNGFSTTNSLADCHEDSTDCATTDASDDNASTSLDPGVAPCGFSFENTIWFEWTAPQTRFYTINVFNQSCRTNPNAVNGGTGVQMMFFSDIDCEDPGVGRANIKQDIFGNDCNNTTDTMDYSYTFQGHANTTYYLVFDGFAGAQCDFKLLISENALFPVDLVDFEGEIKPEGNVLHWTTGSEVNSDRFEIERSFDGIYYHKIGEVSAMGKADLPTVYEFVDENPQVGPNYYRLQQLDIDGAYSRSHVIQLTLFSPKTLTVAPNPFTSSLSIQYGKVEGQVRLRLYDVAGRIVLDQQWADGQSQELPLSLPAGMYFYHLENGLQEAKGKLMRVE